MAFVWLLWRSDLRARWRGLVVMAVLVGIGGGVALTSFAGARRTDAAMGQFIAYSLPDDGGFISGSLESPPVTPGQAPSSLAPDPVARAVVSLPQVVSWARSPFLYLTTDAAGGPSTLTAVGAADAAYFRTEDRPLVLFGHLPAPTAPLEVAVNEFAAQSRHLHVGSVLRLHAYSYAQIQAGAVTGGASVGRQSPAGPSYTVHVAAVVRSPQEVDAVRPLAARQGVPYEAQESVYLTGAFLQHYAADLGIPVTALPDINLYALRLRHGASEWRQFSQAADAVAGGNVFLSAGNAFAVHKAAASAQRGIGVVVVALVLFGSLLSLLTVVLVGQALSRQVSLDAPESTGVRALGATTRQVVAVSALRALEVGVAGGLVAVVVAWLASPIMPIGLAREAEIHPGLSFDPLVLIPGALVLVVLLLPWTAVPAWRNARRPVTSAVERAAESGAGTMSRALAKVALSPSADVGLRFGLESNSGRGGVATAVFGAVVAVGAVAASFTFGNSLTNLEDTPRQQGWNWDVFVGNPNTFTDIEPRAQRLLSNDSFVAGYSAIAILAGANQGNATVDGKLVDLLLAFDPLKGAVYPPLLQGRAPRQADEIVLASKTSNNLHKGIGQWVETAGPDGQPIRLKVVGIMLAPSVGDLFTNGMGEGGWVFGPAVRSALEQAMPQTGSQGATPPTVFNLVAVRFAHGTSTASALDRLRQQFGPVVLRQIPSQDVVNLQSVNSLPSLVAVLVALLGIATVGNTLVGMVRRRRRDIAVLKTVGFLRAQVAGVVAWQATTFSLAALIVGIPVGVVLGRWAWTLVASGIGSVASPQVPPLAVAVTGLVAVLIANVVAVAPAWAAARVPPASVMRSE